MSETACKNCTFAIYDGITQTGCSQDRLKTYSEDEIVEAYDHEKAFYVIKGQCLYNRTDKWRKQVEDAGLTVKERLKKEITLGYNAILICNNNANDVMKTFKSLQKQESRPWRITIVSPYKSGFNLQKEVVPRLKGVKQAWMARQIINPDHQGTKRIIDMCLATNPLPYNAVFHAGFEVPPDTFQILSDKIIKERFVFAMILPNSEDQGMFIPHSVFQHFKIHYPYHSTLDALREEECEEIYKITDLVPSFPK